LEVENQEEELEAAAQALEKKSEERDHALQSREARLNEATRIHEETEEAYRARRRDLDLELERVSAATREAESLEVGMILTLTLTLTLTSTLTLILTLTLTLSVLRRSSVLEAGCYLPMRRRGSTKRLYLRVRVRVREAREHEEVVSYVNTTTI